MFESTTTTTQSSVIVVFQHVSHVQHNLFCVCVCVFSSHSFWTSMDVPAGVTQEEGNTGFSIHLLSALCTTISLIDISNTPYSFLAFSLEWERC